MKRKVVKSFTFVLFLLTFYSCGVKDCQCYSSNVLYQADTVLTSDYDTVYRQTRGSCDEFNIDETLEIDSIRKVHHTIFCD